MKDNCPAIPEYKTHFQAFNIFETTLFVVKLMTIVYLDNVEYIEKLDFVNCILIHISIALLHRL
jgi:hypothetical protein